MTPNRSTPSTRRQCSEVRSRASPPMPMSALFEQVVQPAVAGGGFLDHLPDGVFAGHVDLARLSPAALADDRLGDARRVAGVDVGDDHCRPRGARAPGWQPLRSRILRRLRWRSYRAGSSLPPLPIPVMSRLLVSRGCPSPPDTLARFPGGLTGRVTR